MFNNNSKKINRFIQNQQKNEECRNFDRIKLFVYFGTDNSSKISFRILVGF